MASGLAAFDWDDLRFFLAIAREGSLSAAARRLEVAQPTVGRRLAAFESALGAKLFARTPEGQALTATGRKLLVHAERMEQEALSAARTAAGRDAGLRGPVRITASEWLVDRLLATLLPPLLAAHEGLELELLSDPRHLSLVRGEADIAIRPSRFEHRNVFESQVGSLSFGLYASEGYLAAHGAPDFTRQCEGHALVAMSTSLTKIPDLEWLPLVASRARIAARANARLPMATLLVAGVGIGVLPRVLGDAVPTLRWLKPPVPGPTRSLWLGAHADTRTIPRVRHTIAYLRDALGRRRELLHPRE